MPKLDSGLPRRRGWIAIAIVAVVLMLAGLAVVATRNADEAQAIVAERINQHINAARAAAARALYIYPPPDEPDARTAYVEVITLEKLSDEIGKDATTAAAQLRQEFAQTLVRLGDRYWNRAGGRPFAVDYYIAALAFDPNQPRARERAPITPGGLTDLQQKASTLDFAPIELSASEPLRALAEDDEQERVRKLQELEGKPQEHGVQAQLRIQKLLEDEGAEPSTPSRSRARPRRSSPKEASSSEASSSEASSSEASSSEASSSPEPAVKPPPEIRDNPVPSKASSERAVADSESGPVSARQASKANKFVVRGLSALRKGQRNRAQVLFHRALDQNHRNHRALDGLARVSFARGNYEQAVRYGKRAVSIAPNTAAYRIRLGDAYFKVFRYAEAKTQYRRAEQLGHAGARARLQKVRNKLGR